MTNQEFIKTLMVCGKLVDYNPKRLEELVNSKIDLNKAYREVSNLIKINETGMNDTMVILNTFKSVLDNYKRADKTQEECLYEFIRLLKLKFSVVCDAHASNMFMTVSRSIGALPILRELRLFKIVEIKKDSLLRLNNKIVSVSAYYNIDKNVNQLYIDREQTNYGGVFIKNGVEHYKVVENESDNIELMNEMIRGDFDLALIPPFQMVMQLLDMDKKNDYNNYEFLEYLLLMVSDNSKTDNRIRKAFNKVADYKVDLRDLLRLAKNWRGLNLGILVKFIASVINRLEADGLNLSEQEDYFKEVYEILDTQMTMIKPSNIQRFGDDHIKEMTELYDNMGKNSDVCLRDIKSLKKREVAKINAENEIKYTLVDDYQVLVEKRGNNKVISGEYKIIIDRERQVHVYQTLDEREEVEYYDILTSKNYLLVIR